MGLDCGTPTSFMPPRRRHPVSAGDYNPSLYGLGLKIGCGSHMFFFLLQNEAESIPKLAVLIRTTGTVHSKSLGVKFFGREATRNLSGHFDDRIK